MAASDSLASFLPCPTWNQRILQCALFCDMGDGNDLNPATVGSSAQFEVISTRAPYSFADQRRTPNGTPLRRLKPHKVESSF